MELFRAIIKSILSRITTRSLAQVAGRDDELLDDVPVYQDYGFQSSPPIGSECVILRQGKLQQIVGTNSNQYNVELLPGEVRLFFLDKSVMLLNKDIIIHSKTGITNVFGYDEVKIQSLNTEENGNITILSCKDVNINGIKIFINTDSETKTGVVTGSCKCAYTGLDHPDVSTKVFAGK